MHVRYIYIYMSIYITTHTYIHICIYVCVVISISVYIYIDMLGTRIPVWAVSFRSWVTSFVAGARLTSLLCLDCIIGQGLFQRPRQALPVGSYHIPFKVCSS